MRCPGDQRPYSGSVRLACLQLGGQDLPDPSARRGAAMALAGTITDADLVMLPELWPVGFFHFGQYAERAEPLDGPTAEFAIGLARERGCWVHGGSFIERDGDGLHNTSILIDPAGDVRLLYRKTHLFGYESEESRLLSPGAEAPVVEVDGMSGLRVGAATCYDLRFPELFREMLDAGAECFLVASAWPASRLSHWRTLCRARSVENLAWLVACNAAGTDNGVALAGHSLVIDPWGEIVAEAGAEPCVLVADIDPIRVHRIRKEYPFLGDRGRPTLTPRSTAPPTAPPG